MAKKAKSTKTLEPINYTSINIGLEDKVTLSVANKLQVLLADEQVLYAKTRNYHWNIESSNFMEIHKFYESLYTELAEAIDEVAERIRKIGHYALGRLQDFLEAARLLEGEYTSDQTLQMKSLLDDHETLIRIIREDITAVDKLGDAGTSDFLTALLKDHERWAWFLRSYLNAKA